MCVELYDLWSSVFCFHKIIPIVAWRAKIHVVGPDNIKNLRIFFSDLTTSRIYHDDDLDCYIGINFCSCILAYEDAIMCPIVLGFVLFSSIIELIGSNIGIRCDCIQKFMHKQYMLRLYRRFLKAMLTRKMLAAG